MALARAVTTAVYDGSQDDVLCVSEAADAAYRIGTLPLVRSEYTFSVWARADAAMDVGFNVLGTGFTAAVGPDWQRLSWHVADADASGIVVAPGRNEALYLYQGMLEAGAKATDWRPAPEDAEAQLEDVQRALGTEIDLTREQIALRVRAEDMEMSLRLKEDGVHIGRAGDFYEARISGESFDIMAGPQAVASFRSGLIVIGGWAFRVTADGGLSQSRYEG